MKLSSFGLLIIASLAFATSSPLSRLARSVDPMFIAATRVTLAALVLLVFLRGKPLTEFRRQGAKTRGRIALAGLLLGLHFSFFQWGLATTSLAAAVSLVSLEPASVILCAWFFFGIKPTRTEQIGVGLATVGALGVGMDSGVGTHRLIGDAAVVASVVVYGLYVASARGLRTTMEPLPYATLAYVFAGVFLSVGALTKGLVVFGAPRFWQGDVGSTFFCAAPEDWKTALTAIVLLALIPTIVGHTLVQAGARTLSPSLLALVSPGETLGSLLIGWIMLAERPGFFEGLGAIIIVFGTTMALTGTRAAQVDVVASD